MSDRLELEYDGDSEVHVVVCRPPSGKLFVHMKDEPFEAHGAESYQVDTDATLFLSGDAINDVDA